MAENAQTEKLHAACDECRTRKLKCSGDTPQCSRCRKESIRCVYSPQKQMGRPRKRRRDDDAQLHDQTAEKPGHSTTGSLNDPSFGDFGMISPPNLDDYSSFTSLQPNDDLANSFVSAQHDPVFTSGYAPVPIPAFDVDLATNIDPSLWDAQPLGMTPDAPVPIAPAETAEGPCTCLSILYLTLTDLQTMTVFSFPQVVPTLRQAMSTASSIIHCEKCPKEPFSAVQNVLTLTSLFSALASRFHKVLHEIDKEAGKLQQSGDKKPFRVGDSSPQTAHLHTGTLDCPMAFYVELDPQEWRKLAKKALRTEVLGGGINLTPLSALLDQFQERQQKWHDSTDHYEERCRMFGSENMCKPPDDAHCLRMITNVRTMVASMVWE